MDNSDQSDKNNATVIRPRKNDRPTGNPPNRPDGQPAAKADRTVLKTSPSLEANQVLALTQISHALKSSDSSVGFENARKAADLALANNKIIMTQF